MAKALELNADLLATPPAVPRAARTDSAEPVAEKKATSKKARTKVDLMPLQVRWPRSDVKAAKLATVQGDFPTLSDFMLTCFHEYMKKANR